MLAATPIDKSHLNLEDLGALLIRVEKALAASNLASKPMLSAEECAEYTGYSLSAIRNFVSQREIPYYKNHGKVLFDRKEIDRWLHIGRVSTNDEIEQRANNYITLKNITQNGRLTGKN